MMALGRMGLDRWPVFLRLMLLLLLRLGCIMQQPLLVLTRLPLMLPLKPGVWLRRQFGQMLLLARLFRLLVPMLSLLLLARLPLARMLRLHMWGCLLLVPTPGDAAAGLTEARAGNPICAAGGPRCRGRAAHVPGPIRVNTPRSARGPALRWLRQCMQPANVDGS